MCAIAPLRRTRAGNGLAAACPRHPRGPGANRALALAAGLLGLLGTSANAEITTVQGTSNIFGAGHTLAPDPGSYGPGTLPTMLAVFPAPQRTITFDTVTGLVTCLDRLGWNGADGGNYATGDTDILSFGGISGIKHDHATMFLVGVFTGENEPMGPAPVRLDVTAATGNTEFHPLLYQTFFIGDGRTGTGSGALQVFYVPEAATKLYLGFADGYGFGDPVALPGSYNDNAGELTVHYTVVPAPGCGLLAAAGSLMFTGRRRRS